MSSLILSQSDPDDEPSRSHAESKSSTSAAAGEQATSSADESPQSGPADGSDPPGGQAQHAHQRKQRRPKFSTADECLAALAQLPGWVALNMITPAQSNSIRAALAEILRHVAAQTRGSDGKPRVDQSVLERVRDDAELLNALEPILSDEQLAWLMQDEKVPPHG